MESVIYDKILLYTVSQKVPLKTVAYIFACGPRLQTKIS